MVHDNGPHLLEEEKTGKNQKQDLYMRWRKIIGSTVTWQPHRTINSHEFYRRQKWGYGKYGLWDFKPRMWFTHREEEKTTGKKRSQQDLEQQLRRAAQTAPTQGKKEETGPDEVHPQENLFQRTSI